MTIKWTLPYALYTSNTFQMKWAIHSFQEEYPIKALNNKKVWSYTSFQRSILIFQVVDDVSSCFDSPAIEVTEHISCNHMDMCRFSAPEDIEYRKVATALSHITESLASQRTTSA